MEYWMMLSEIRNLEVFPWKARVGKEELLASAGKKNIPGELE